MRCRALPGMIAGKEIAQKPRGACGMAITEAVFGIRRGRRLIFLGSCAWRGGRPGGGHLDFDTFERLSREAVKTYPLNISAER